MSFLETKILEILLSYIEIMITGPPNINSRKPKKFFFTKTLAFGEQYSSKYHCVLSRFKKSLATPFSKKGVPNMSQKDKYFFNVDAMSQGVARKLTEGINTRIFPGEQAMISVVRIDPNAVGAIHSHSQEQWGLMLEGSAIRIQDGEKIPVQKGDFWLSPGGIEHGVIGGPSGAVILDIFSPPRDEYTRPGSGFGKV